MMTRTHFYIIAILQLVSPSYAYTTQQIEQWGQFELTFDVPEEVDKNQITLTAVFTLNDTTITVRGFHDGGTTFRVRFMPQYIGSWSYTTKSNIRKLNNKKGHIDCVMAKGNNHGMVQTSNTNHFTYADGTPYYPFGTTAYAWIHMPEDKQKLTLQTLKQSGFNKIRMCIFPKNYNLVHEEPELYPFEYTEVRNTETGFLSRKWNFNSFNPVFFHQLEKRIYELAKLGIEADLILFHPYDKGRWGFDSLPEEVNLRYIEHITARLSSFRNVWWSIANEWDLVKSKSVSNWEILSKAVVSNDPYKHLCSIHGSTASYFNYHLPEFTHISIQDETPVQSPAVIAILRAIYNKPIICDEVGYEGNLPSRWGRLSAEEMTHLVWNGVMGGGYVTHGECFQETDTSNTLFWAKGGKFNGLSWQRISFLKNIMEDGPSPIAMADISRDSQTASANSEYYLVYFGTTMQESWLFNLPAKNREFDKLTAGKLFNVEIIDTQSMKIIAVPDTFETAVENDYRLYDVKLKKVRLPLKPYLALRIKAISLKSTSNN